MSFIKVTDPKKREALVRDFIETRKRIKDNFISRKVGESEYQTGLTKLFKPVTETQKTTAKEITDAQKAATKEITDTQKKAIKDITGELIPIQEGIDRLPKVPPPLYSELPFAAEDEIPDIEETVKELPNFVKKEEKGYKIGDFYFDFDEVNKNVLSKSAEIFTDSPEIYILTNKKSNQRWENLNDDEKRRLGVLISHSKAIKKNLNNSPVKIGGNNMWNNVFSHIWFNRFQYIEKEEILKNDELKNDAIKLLKRNHIKTTDETKKRIQEIIKGPKPGTSGTGLKILPSDPNALIERFDLLFSSKKAGHTGVRNEIISILDELKRQGVININDYKKLNSLIKK